MFNQKKLLIQLTLLALCSFGSVYSSNYIVFEPRECKVVGKSGINDTSGNISCTQSSGHLFFDTSAVTYYCCNNSNGRVTATIRG
ncbi:hypothetical protein BCR32DRAFT_61965 [Anaeromyces robustus]|uniref:Cyanovirin-N domain-containing protein n=1 Tax=Anaeromyces robustus TaxID=1754192 RepID=A0A1Y1WV49_9FUNG|nr:hypothetical protein BCR32DRAFT_61965 [Anaeromyces robustus]|eukprot:ORX77332.1 hypothetical protein BCR32DRAFT_61965 [Anaeromyces robustus]